MFLVLFVLHDPELMEEVLSAWEHAGVSGVTILHSSGLGRTRQAMLRDDLPIFPTLESLELHSEEFSRTLFSVVSDQSVIDRIVTATQQITGNFSLPETGVLVVLPVSQAYGLNKNQPR